MSKGISTTNCHRPACRRDSPKPRWASSYHRRWQMDYTQGITEKKTTTTKKSPINEYTLHQDNSIYWFWVGARKKLEFKQWINNDIKSGVLIYWLNWDDDGNIKLSVSTERLHFTWNWQRCKDTTILDSDDNGNWRLQFRLAISAVGHVCLWISAFIW